MVKSGFGRSSIDRADLFESRGNWGSFNVHTLRHSFVVDNELTMPKAKTQSCPSCGGEMWFEKRTETGFPK